LERRRENGGTIRRSKFGEVKKGSRGENRDLFKKHKGGRDPLKVLERDEEIPR